jgi:uncharacterized membrane protein YoaK (UPF0700 family)
LVSITAFVIGCFFFSLLRKFGARKKGVFCASFAIQAVRLIISAALVQGKAVPGMASNEESMTVLIPLVLLGLQAGGQVSASDVLDYKEIPTTVLTSVYFGIAADTLLCDRKNPKRNRKIAAIVLLLLRAVSGGWLSKIPDGIPIIFWIAGGLKFCISIAWLFWKADVLYKGAFKSKTCKNKKR